MSKHIRHCNRTVVDLRKVGYAILYWRSGEYHRALKPNVPTVRGIELQEEKALNHPDFPDETVIERAKRLELLDKWVPVFHCVLNNGHTLEFTGKKALALANKYNSMIFKT